MFPGNQIKSHIKTLKNKKKNQTLIATFMIHELEILGLFFKISLTSYQNLFGGGAICIFLMCRQCCRVNRERVVN